MRFQIGHLLRSNVTGYKPEAGLPEHILLCIMRGSAWIQANGQKFLVDSPQLVLIEPGVAYEIVGNDRCEMWEEYWMIFSLRPHWRRLLEWPTQIPGIGGLLLDGLGWRTRFVREFAQLHDTVFSGEPYCRDFAINTFERILLLIIRYIAPSRPHGLLDPRIRHAVDYIQNHLASSIKVEDVARHVHLSESHLAHLFSEQTGEAPMAFFERLRMEHGRSLLLETKRSIADIAGEVGFSNPMHFSTRFRKHAGLSPRAFREQHRSR